MKPKDQPSFIRRQPTQRRARLTVDAVLDSVMRLLKRGGARAITTNRIAEVAGVSIGSVYQYFPDKRAIFSALHERHVESIDRVVQSALIKHASSSLDQLIRAMIEALVDAHAVDPELHDLLAGAVPHRPGQTQEFAVRLHGAFRLAIASRAHELKKRTDIDKTVFVVTHMVEALSHGAVQRRPPGLSLADAREEAVQAVFAYLFR
jgi:AcrR family transcriptional regulator